MRSLMREKVSVSLAVSATRSISSSFCYSHLVLNSKCLAAENEFEKLVGYHKLMSQLVFGQSENNDSFKSRIKKPAYGVRNET